jgi:hypothetical protein
MYSDYLAELTPAGQTVWEWRTCEHLDPVADGIAEVQAPRTLWVSSRSPRKERLSGNTSTRFLVSPFLAARRPLRATRSSARSVTTQRRSLGREAQVEGEPPVTSVHAVRLAETNKQFCCR